MQAPEPAPELTAAAELKDWRHTLPVEVFISDTDSYAIIYHTNYLKYFERARAELFGLDALRALRAQVCRAHGVR